VRVFVYIVLAVFYIVFRIFVNDCMTLKQPVLNEISDILNTCIFSNGKLCMSRWNICEVASKGAIRLVYFGIAYRNSCRMLTLIHVFLLETHFFGLSRFSILKALETQFWAFHIPTFYFHMSCIETQLFPKMLNNFFNFCFYGLKYPSLLNTHWCTLNTF
jgi:hypothetical protein